MIHFPCTPKEIVSSLLSSHVINKCVRHNIELEFMIEATENERKFMRF